jgi:hypothetical protein
MGTAAISRANPYAISRSFTVPPVYIPPSLGRAAGAARLFDAIHWTFRGAARLAGHLRPPDSPVPELAGIGITGYD